MLKSYKIMILHDKGGWSGTLRIPGFTLPLFGLVVALLVGGMVFWVGRYQDVREVHAAPVAFDELDLEQKDSLFDLAIRLETMDRVLGEVTGMNVKLKIMLGLSDTVWGEANNDQGQPRYHLAAMALVSYRNMIREMHQMVEFMNQGLHAEEIEQNRIMTELDLQRDSFTRIPSIWPTLGRFSSPFGYRRSPFTGTRDFHRGIDITASTGTEIWAPASGRVTYAGSFTSYGIIVEITHGNGIMTRFAHMSRVNVDEGDWVERGDVVGFVGNTGRSVAPHLHYEVHVSGTVNNPMNYILN